MNNEAATNSGALVVRSPYVAIIGAIIPRSRLRAEQSASPVPLCGAGNTSGVYAYRTPYIAFWVRAVAQLNPRTPASLFAWVNRKRKMPVRQVEDAMANLRPPNDHLPPPRVQSTMIQAMMDPGIPRTDTIE